MRFLLIFVLGSSLITLCSKKVIFEELLRSNCDMQTILEDDFKPKIENFRENYDLINSNIPNNSGVVFLDSWILKGGVVPVANNPYVNMFSLRTLHWGNHAFIITKLGAKIFNQIEIYHTTSDNTLTRLDLERIITTEKFNAYIASHNFSQLASIEYSGRSTNSEISQTGCRTSLKRKDLNCTNDVPMPIEEDVEVKIMGEDNVINDEF